MELSQHRSEPKIFRAPFSLTVIRGLLIVAAFALLASVPLWMPAMNSKPDLLASAQIAAVPAGFPVPAVDLHVMPADGGGWLVEIEPTNFIVRTECSTEQRDILEGHAHLYINGQKIGTMFSHWHYVTAMPPGLNVVTVTLNTAQHRALTMDGRVIGASMIVAAQDP